MLWEFRNAGRTGGATLGSVQQTADGRSSSTGAPASSRSSRSCAPNGTRLMAVGLPNGGNSYRTVKYPPSDFDVNVLRATAGGAITPP